MSEFHYSMKLEIGVGTTLDEHVRKEYKYPFHPRLPGKFVLYSDIRPPDVRLGISDRFVVLDAHHLPFKDSVFEEVGASHVIEHLNNPLLFLKECYRVLKPNGKLHIWCPNMQRKSIMHKVAHVGAYHFLSLRRLMHQAGFRIFAFNFQPHPSLPNIVRRALKLFYAYTFYELYLIAIK